MKKTLLILAISFFTICVSAQTAFGIKAGVNLATMNFDIEEEFLGEYWDRDIHPILTASVLGQIELSYSTNLTLELGLVQRGLKVSFEEGNNSSSIEQRFNQIQFSPGIAFKVLDEFSFGFGPYIGYASKAKIKLEVTIDGDTISSEEDYDLEDEEKLDYGLNANLNYLINNVCLISAGYSLGLKDYNEQYDDSSLDPLKNRGVMLSVGYLFN